MDEKGESTVEIRQLQTFQTIIAEGSYTKAAQKLAYTQSTITAHMQAIEKAIGAPAFVYQKRQLVLSEQGKLLQPLAEELLMNYQQILALKQMPQLKGELRIAAPESLLIYRLAPLLREYTELYPEVKIILSNASCGVNQQLKYFAQYLLELREVPQPIRIKTNRQRSNR